jgi:CheY-like chemotaxis protein
LKERTNSLAQRNTDWLEGRLSAATGEAALIADDSESDIFFLLRTFARSFVKNPVFVVRSGAEAIQYLEGTGRYCNRTTFPLPKIVFLDLKMPGLDGFDVLRWKEERADLPKILWVAMSNFDGVRTINEAYRCGATTFLSKPLDAEDIRHMIDSFDDFWQIGEPSANNVADSGVLLPR